MGEYAEFLAHIINPEDIRMFIAEDDGFHGIGGHVFRLVLEYSVVAVGHAIHVEADDFTAVGDDISLIAGDGGRGAEADEFPVADLAGTELRDDQLPEEIAGFLIEAQQVPTVAGLAGIARRFVIRADEDLAVGDDRVAVGLGAELGGPEDVFRTGEIDGFILRVDCTGIDIGGNALGLGDHVAGGSAAPHWPVLGLEGGAEGE